MESYIRFHKFIPFGESCQNSWNNILTVSKRNDEYSVRCKLQSSKQSSKLLDMFNKIILVKNIFRKTVFKSGILLLNKEQYLIYLILFYQKIQ